MIQNKTLYQYKIFLPEGVFETNNKYFSVFKSKS